MNKLAAALALFLLALPSLANAQTLPLLSVPTETYLTAQPGQIITTKIGLKNTTKKTIQARVTSSDFTPSTQTDTAPTLSKPNATYGLYNWLTDSNLQKTINIPGDQTVQYNATFRVPKNAGSRTYYGAVVFTNTATSQQLSAKVYITVGAATTSPTISSLSYGPSSLATQKYGVFSVSTYNQGSGYITPTLTLKLTDQNGNTVNQTTLSNQENLMPESAKTYYIAPTIITYNSTLTATVSLVDQNGNTADKTIQIFTTNNANTPANATNAQTPPSSNTRLLIAGGLIAILIAAKALKLRRRKNR